MQQVIIMQGVSGSGKSTLTSKYKAELNAVVVSADDYFIVDGNYIFNPVNLGKAHATCYSKFLEAIHEGFNIIVDNTNASAIEIAPYAAAVQAISIRGQYKYQMKIVRVVRNLESCIKHNTHGVSAATITAQADRIERFHNGGNVYRWECETHLTKD